MNRAPHVATTVIGGTSLLALATVVYQLENAALALGLTALATSSALAVFALGFASLGPGAATARLGLGPGRLSGLQIGTLVVGTLAVSHGLDTLIELTGWSDFGALAEIDSSLRGTRGPTLLFTLLCLALAPGIGEELLFRGLLQRSFVQWFGPGRAGTALGITLAAALFGLVHSDPVHSPAAFVLGLYLGAIAHLGRSIRPAMVCHAANNALAMAAAAFTLEIGVGPWVPAAAFLVAAAALGLARPATGSTSAD